jgi:hypothetical protein
MGFVGIGLETDLRLLITQLRDIRPLILYFVIQFFEFGVDFFFSWLAFGIIWENPKL